MRSHIPLLCIIIGLILGSIFEEQIHRFKHINEFCIILFGLITIDFLIRILIVKKKRLLIRTKSDIIYQAINIILGILIIVFFIYKWYPNSYFHWCGLFIGIILFLSGLFYENSIQLLINDKSLMIDYKYKENKKLDNVYKIELDKSVLRFINNDMILEVYNLRQKDSDRVKIVEYLKRKLNNVEIIIK